MAFIFISFSIFSIYFFQSFNKVTNFTTFFRSLVRSFFFSSETEGSCKSYALYHVTYTRPKSHISKTTQTPTPAAASLQILNVMDTERKNEIFENKKKKMKISFKFFLYLEVLLKYILHMQTHLHIRPCIGLPITFLGCISVCVCMGGFC